jgi:hypothetical protein
MTSVWPHYEVKILFASSAVHPGFSYCLSYFAHKRLQVPLLFIEVHLWKTA